MTAVDITFGIAAHLGLSVGGYVLVFIAPRLRGTDGLPMAATVAAIIGLIGASYFWARVAGFA